MMSENTRGIRSQRLAVAVALGVAVVAAAAPSNAQESGYDFKLFGGAANVAPQSDSSLAGIANSVEASSEYGWEIGGEWKPSNRFGFELAYLDAEHDVEADGTAIGKIDLRPWTVTANFHLVNRNAFDWYVGPTLTYIDWSEIALNGGGTLDVDSETSYGISTGVDIGFGNTFALQLGLRWLEASVESDVLPGEVSVDPLFARVGVAFRF